MRRYGIRYVLIGVACFAAIGGFIALFGDTSQGVHGTGGAILLGYSRNQIVASLLFMVAGIAGVGSLILHFSQHRAVYRAVVLALSVGIALTILLLGMIWLLSSHS